MELNEFLRSLPDDLCIEATEIVTEEYGSFERSLQLARRFSAFIQSYRERFPDGLSIPDIGKMFRLSRSQTYKRLAAVKSADELGPEGLVQYTVFEREENRMPTLERLVAFQKGKLQATDTDEPAEPAEPADTDTDTTTDEPAEPAVLLDVRFNLSALRGGEGDLRIVINADGTGTVDGGDVTTDVVVAISELLTEFQNGRTVS
jgi:hypothetical protein